MTPYLKTVALKPPDLLETRGPTDFFRNQISSDFLQIVSETRKYKELEHE